MKVNSHAGHGKQNSRSCGAYTYLLKESVENRDINRDFISYMRKEGHTVFDCTVDYPDSQADCINRIVKNCNANVTDIDISWHFNSGRNNINGDSKIGGVEVILYDSSKNSPVVEANRVLKELSSLGFTNRGVKYNKNLGYLRDTKGRSMIIEVCFVDDKDDVVLYRKVKDQIGKKVAEAILNKKIGEEVLTTDKIKIKIDGKYYELTGIFKDNTNYIKVRDLEKAGFIIGNEENIATVESPCCCKK